MWAWIIAFSLRSKLLVIAAAVAILIAGYQLFKTAPVDVYPDINDPRVTIMTEAHGWSPEEMETLVTFPLETALNGAPYVQRVRSSSGVGLSIIFAEFEWGTDIMLARQIVSERLQTVAPSLPKGVFAPVMLPITSRLGEVVEYALEDVSGNLSLMEMRDIADWTIRYQLQSLGGVADVINLGGYLKQYQVLLKPERLINYGLTLEEAAQALEKSNLNAAGGFLLEGSKEYMIRSLGRIEDLADVESVVVANFDGMPILVKDLAEVRIGFLPKIRRGAGSLNGEEAVLGKISKQPGVNTLQITDKIMNSFDQMKTSLPESVKIRPEYVQAHFINRAVDTVKDALRDGAILVVLVLMLFLWNLRPSVITLTSIPLSLTLAVIVLVWQGQSINIMTLSGLAIAVGMVVDDSIIDVENIFRRLRQYFKNRTGETPTQVVLRASNEIRSAIVYATLIIVLVFLPLFSLSGLEGRMFQPLGLAVIIAMAASLLVALTLIPVLSDLILSGQNRLSGQKESPLVRGIKVVYRPVLGFIMRHRLLTALAALLLAIASVISIPRMGREFLPVMDEATFTINAIFPPGTSLEESTRVARRMEKLLLEVLEVTSVTNRTGRAERDEHAEGVHYNELLVNLKPPEERTKSREDLIKEIEGKLSQFPGVVVAVGQPIQHRLDHLLSGVSAQVAIKVFGGDLKVLREKAQQVNDSVAKVEGVSGLQIEPQVPIPQLQVKVDREAAARHGLAVEDIAHFAEVAFNGEAVSQVILGQRQYDLFVRLDDESINDVEKIRNLQMRTPSGQLVPLKVLAGIRFAEGPNTINRENVSRRVVVQCNVVGRDLGSFIDEAQKRVKAEVTLPEGYFISYGGQFESQQRASRQILTQSIFVILGIFLLLYLSMRSFKLSFLVVLNLPLALVGGVVSVFLSGGVLSIPSMVGFILLFGIAVRNGIILIDHINNLRQEGMELKESIIKGAEERISPVLMTALTTILGMLPLAIASGSGSELQKPLAIVILGGMITSTVLTLLVLPALYYLVEQRGGSS